jgi:hypothetical protein
MKEVMEYAIPLLVRRGGRDIKKMLRSLLIKGADGVVAHTETLLVRDHPGCGAKVGFAEIFLMPLPPLLVRRGMRMAHEFPYCISYDFLHPCE